MFLKLWHCQIIWNLFLGLKIIILCFVHTVWFVKYVFFAKIWFVETSVRIVKYESRIVKSNPVESLWIRENIGVIYEKGWGLNHWACTSWYRLFLGQSNFTYYTYKWFTWWCFLFGQFFWFVFCWNRESFIFSISFPCMVPK